MTIKQRVGLTCFLATAVFSPTTALTYASARVVEYPIPHAFYFSKVPDLLRGKQHSPQRFFSRNAAIECKSLTIRGSVFSAEVEAIATEAVFGKCIGYIGANKYNATVSPALLEWNASGFLNVRNEFKITITSQCELAIRPQFNIESIKYRNVHHKTEMVETQAKAVIEFISSGGACQTGLGTFQGTSLIGELGGNMIWS